MPDKICGVTRSIFQRLCFSHPFVLNPLPDALSGLRGFCLFLKIPPPPPFLLSSHTAKVRTHVSALTHTCALTNAIRIFTIHSGTDPPHDYRLPLWCLIPRSPIPPISLRSSMKKKEKILIQTYINNCHIVCPITLYRV